MSRETSLMPIRSFDLGPEGLAPHGRFILGAGDWKTALRYNVSVNSIPANDIPFEDVRLFVTNLQAEAATWAGATYPHEIVPLASAVVQRVTAMQTYLPALGKALAGLGSDPTNAGLLKEVDAVLQVLADVPSAQGAAASNAAAQARAFGDDVADGEKKLRVLFSVYATVYFGGQDWTPSPHLSLPEGLAQSVESLGSAWGRQAREIADLKDWIDTNAAKGRVFNADIDIVGAVQLWQAAASAADTWRQNAYVI